MCQLWGICYDLIVRFRGGFYHFSEPHRCNHLSQFIPIHMQYFISQSFSYSSNILPPKSFLHSDVTLDVLWAVSSRYPKDNRASTCCKPTDTAHTSQRSRCWDSPCLMNSPDLVDHIFVRLSYTKFSYFNNSPKDLCFLFFMNKSIVSVEFNS